MKVIFCIPGNKFSDRWIHSWMDTLNVMSKHGIEWIYSINYDPVVYYARNRVLGGNNVDGRYQKPFRGQLEYDYTFWIDSDIVWDGEQVVQLLQQDKDIISGAYMMANNQELPIVESLDYTRLLEQGTFRFMRREEIKNRHSPFTVSYTGFGFMAIKKKVIESMEYPWFRPKFVEKDLFHEFTAEDVSFCWEAKERGFEIWIDPTVQVGHQKSITIVP